MSVLNNGIKITNIINQIIIFSHVTCKNKTIPHPINPI